MGLTQVSTAIYDLEEKAMYDRFPVIGLQKTHSASDLVTDSGASATAIACGIKTYNHAIGVGLDTLPRMSILEMAEAEGMASGVIATASIVHATPAAFYAHHWMRVEYEAIALHLLDSGIDFFVGGGKKYFDRRADERDLIDELREKGYSIRDYFDTDLSAALINPAKKFGYFSADNRPVAAIQGRNYLPKATRMGMDYLEKSSEKGFFLMVEGSQIDWTCHSNKPNQLKAELKDFNEAIQEALKFYIDHPNTLIVLTADHETGGLAINKGSKAKRLDLEFTTNGHTATMVPVFAIGPGSQYFNGIYDNTELHKRLLKAMGWTSG
ncbi:MAG: alkaline phosphatase [Bacteroidetes bacterium]|nr:alkaline phosphatase [Bacteroidota bacterium]